jgi:hypothetical protein
MPRPYTLYKRFRKNKKPVYYVQFRNPDGTRLPGVCSGCESRAAAEQWAVDKLKEQKIFTKKNTPSFEEFTHDFFSRTVSWATDKKVRGLRISERQCLELTRVLNKTVNPTFGKIKISQIDRSVIKTFRNNLFNSGLAGNTINKSLSVIKVIHEAAEEQWLVKGIP